MQHEPTFMPMTTEQFDALMAALKDIRLALEARSAAPAASKPAEKAKSDGSIPLPTEIISEPELVQIHFGKNKGRALGELSRRSLEWYAQDAEPRLRNDGTPFPPREADVLLRNAARTIIHGSGSKAASQSKPAETLSDETPF